MGESLTVLLLGTPELAVGERPLAIRSVKSRALLCYLAAVPAPRPRAELAALLWGDRPDDKARGSLRLALSELRRHVGGWLDVTRDHVALRTCESCFVDYRQLARAGSIDQALRLWRGELLEGLPLPDAPGFSAWLADERHRARLLLRDLLRSGRAGPDRVARLARLLTELDPYDEEVRRTLMTALAETGNRAAALACYEDLRRRLAADLAVAPSPETRALRRSLTPPRPALPAPTPAPTTSLVGREDELRHLTTLLDTERLVTLLGPGGVGKTRLAMATARAMSTGRAEPAAVFAGFAGVGADAAVTTLARRLGVDLSPPRPVLDLLAEALAGRSTLLVLDNLEHLPAFDAVIGEILRRAPGVRILATSRRRLALPQQATVTVTGLPAREAETLFAERAAKADPAFDPDREAPYVAAVCAATGGLPLAVELAAGLLRALSCAELAERLGGGLDLLAAPGPAARPRHAGMRTVFETSWRLLDPAARAALAALSVCGGGFTLEAGLRIARTSESTLVRLADHSMIERGPSGRYAMHPLIQRFAAAHLAEDPAARRAAARRHAAHFTRLLATHAAAVQDGSDTDVVGVLEAELDNIRPAWTVSGEPAFLSWYWTLCLRLRLYEEAVAVVRRHRARTKEPPELEARWLRMEGVGRYQLADERDALRLARAALTTLGAPLPSTRPGLIAAILTAILTGALARLPRFTVRLNRRATREGAAEAAQALSLIAKLAYHQQDLATMLAAALRQLNAADRSGEPGLLAEAYANFATIARLAGLRRTADRYGALADSALNDSALNDSASAEGAGAHADAVHRARLARGLGRLAAGELAEAWESFAEGRARTLDPRLAENCAGMLAETALYRGEFARAVELYDETADLAARRVGDDLGRHWCLTGKAEAMLRLPDARPDEIRRVLAAARDATDRRHLREDELGLGNGTLTRVLQEIRLRVATARTDLLDGRTEEARDGAARALELLPRLPAAQPGLVECWAGLAELLAATGACAGEWREVRRGLARYVARNPGAAARCGWAGALLLEGDRRSRAARDALAAAERMDVPYDRKRARDVLDGQRGLPISVERSSAST